MNLLTIIVIIIFALFTLRGYRRGFLKSLASMASLLVSILLVNFATPYVTDFLKEQMPLYDYILERCETAFSVSGETEGTDGQADSADGTVDIETEAAEEADTQTKNGQTTALQEQIIESLPIPAFLQNLLKENNTPQEYAALAAKSFYDYVPKYMAELILNLISFVLTLILVVSFIGLLVMTMDVIANLPVLHGINRILGLALGFVQGLLAVWIAFLIITIFSHTDVGGQLMQMIADSPILDALYDANILLDFLRGLVA